MLSKTRNSRSLHRVIAYICCIYCDAWCITCGWWVLCLVPYSSCIFNTVVVVPCHIETIQGFSRCRGYWIWIFCCLFVVYIYVRLIMSSYLFLYQISIYFNVWYITCCPKWKALEFTYRVISEILVLGLLVVVYKIPYLYNSCMWTRQDEIGVFPSYYLVLHLSIWYNVCACHSPVYHYFEVHRCYYCCLPRTMYHSCMCRGCLIL